MSDAVEAAIELERRLRDLERNDGEMKGHIMRLEGETALAIDECRAETKGLRGDLVASHKEVMKALDEVRTHQVEQNGKLERNVKDIEIMTHAVDKLKAAAEADAQQDHDAAVRMDERLRIGSVLTRKQIGVLLALIVAAGGVAANVRGIIDGVRGLL